MSYYLVNRKSPQKPCSATPIPMCQGGPAASMTHNHVFSLERGLLRMNLDSAMETRSLCANSGHHGLVDEVDKKAYSLLGEVGCACKVHEIQKLYAESTLDCRIQDEARPAVPYVRNVEQSGLFSWPIDFFFDPSARYRPAARMCARVCCKPSSRETAGVQPSSAAAFSPDV